MPRNQEIYVSGKVKFSFLTRLNQYGKWVIGLYPDQQSLDKIKTLIDEGIKNELKKDDDGYWIVFSRPPDKKDRTGRLFSLTPPVVIDKEGRVLTEPVGSGSDVSVKLEVYGGKTPLGSSYKAARLGGVKVFNLVPYNPEESLDEREARLAKGLNSQSEPVDRW